MPVHINVPDRGRPNIFEGFPFARICPVNSVGIMGNGLAAYFKLRYPDMFKEYVNACNGGWFSVYHDNKVLLHHKVHNGPDVICLKTKEHWSNDSNLALIERSLVGLREYCEANGVNSLGMPGIGCGKGNLQWSAVLSLIHEVFDPSTVMVFVYPPT